MPRVHQHAIGQCPRLRTVGLVGRVEQGAQLGMLGQQQLVKMGGEGFAAGLQQGDSGFDDGAVFDAQHDGLQSRWLEMKGCLVQSMIHAIFLLIKINCLKFK